MSRNTARKSTTVDKSTLKALIKEAMDERDESKSDETEEKEGGEDILDIVAAALESADAKRKARKEDGEDVGELTPEEVLEEVAALMEEEKSDDEDDEEKSEQEEEESKRKSARRPSAAKRRAPVVVDRKYSSFYGDAMKPTVMNHAAEGERKGMNFARSIKCQYLAMLNRTTAGEIADYLYKGTDVARQLKAMNVSNPIAGGFFVPEAYANEIIPLLHAQAVISALGATRIDMPNGNMNIPKIKGGAMAYYSGELRPIKESQPTIGNVRLTAKKLTALVPMSSELLMSAAYSNDEMFLNDLIQAITLQMDYAGLFGKGGEYEPLGLLNIKGVRKENYNGPIDADSAAAFYGSGGGGGGAKAGNGSAGSYSTNSGAPGYQGIMYIRIPA